MEINKKMDLQVASLKTVLESLKLETIRYLAGKHVCLLQSAAAGWVCKLKRCLCPVSLLSHRLLLPGHRSGSLPAVEVKELNSSPSSTQSSSSENASISEFKTCCCYKISQFNFKATKSQFQFISSVVYFSTTQSEYSETNRPECYFSRSTQVLTAHSSTCKHPAF